MQSAMLARALRHRGLAWLQLAAQAAGRASPLGSSGLGLLGGSAGSPQHLPGRGLLAAAARRSSSSTGAASEAAAQEAAAEAAGAEAAAADAAAAQQGRKPRRRAAPAPARRGTVLLVESPAKAKKIQGFLGPEYKVSERPGSALRIGCPVCWVRQGRLEGGSKQHIHVHV